MSSITMKTGVRMGAEHSPSTAVVHLELNRVRGHAKTGDLLHLEADIGVDYVVGEHPAPRQELAIFVEMLDGHVQGMANRRNMFSFLRLEVVEILVRGVSRVELVLNAVEAGHHHGREGEVRV